MGKSAIFVAFVSAITLVQVHGHAHITSWTAGGAKVPGFEYWTYKNTNKLNSSWYSENGDNGFVASKDMNAPDIICHKAAKPGSTLTNIAAGSKVGATWSAYADSHKGPLISYLAPCEEDCASAIKANLKWTKIQEAGFEGGAWLTDKMRVGGGMKTDVTIPASLKPGKYVLRHELIALHGAQNGDAQFYPQCINLEVKGSGSAVPPPGVSGTKLYSSKEPGVVFNLYAKFTTYPIPGPKVWKG